MSPSSLSVVTCIFHHRYHYDDRNFLQVIFYGRVLALDYASEVMNGTCGRIRFRTLKMLSSPYLGIHPLWTFVSAVTAIAKEAANAMGIFERRPQSSVGASGFES